MTPPFDQENGLIHDFFLDVSPVIPPSVFIAGNAVVLGATTLGEQASVWYHAVVRADIQRIHIGDCSNVQDGAVLHVADHLPCVIGQRVTVGHRAIVHACSVGDDVLVGMGAIIMDGAHIGAGSIIGAGALVPKGMVIPPGSLVVGTPGKVIRQLTQEESAANTRLAMKYVEVARRHREAGHGRSGT
jgi:gamma-carbonic anhydrase